MGEWFENFTADISGFVWGLPLIIFLVGTGLYLTIRLAFFSFRMLPYSLKLVFTKADTKSEGDITHFQALMTALAATVGTGNVVGVATAVVIGGPGAVFWMWITALVGMATKYSEGVLGVKYRQKNAKGEMSGGPMYYLEYGLGQKWLGVLFAFFAVFAAIFGIGNMIQANAASGVALDVFNIPVWVTGIVFAVLIGLVLIGGVKSIGKTASILVPFMVALYLIAGVLILVLHIDQVPAAFGLIFSDAFTGNAVAGGALGTVIRMGVARGLFSNEAGLGTGGIAAAAARTDVPPRQALVSMTQVFIDTIIVCTITGVSLTMAGLYTSGTEGAALTAQSFDQLLPGFGDIIVAVTLLTFIFSTILGWGYFGEKCFTYLVGDNFTLLYRVIFVLAIIPGATMSLGTVWNLGDIFNGLMAVPNLIGLLLLSGVVAAETKEFISLRKREKQEVG
ncbi:alanine/glycine:cation symporter family protein [Salinicoccus roseus]|jgi:AGCS family alanine or glycine:cation symporter|uniref:Sodium:alanine symporter family protein n=1 Tax=Salinicoccus roseus TaxID=45670 RepID=A0A265E4G5_9STAP|nr:sodium:alanine symporter family protein [Salinicoccus roseus]MBY8909357.1 sodium:alanine symporter family protein [Salinicoccus roseus]OZT76477.1 sodium:alanine symporter family protein [Salinicoccus roseus]RPE51063.1 AGCS family alanine or glycine:cation symporter [Salinicoccus roseus]GGA78294.1 transporter [Salinicoccus roseus]